MKSRIYILFANLISPIFTIYFVLRNSPRSQKRWALILFSGFYGALITIDPRYDGYRHWGRVYTNYSDLSFTAYFDHLITILKFDPEQNLASDAYLHTLSYLLGSVFGVPWLFFTIVGLIYGYFYFSSLEKIYYYIPAKKKGMKGLFWIVFSTLTIWQTLDGMNTVRTWTGMWILIYACLSYHDTKKIKYLILLFVPPLIHFSYIIMAIPAWIVAFLGVRKYLYSLAFFVSFAFPFAQGIIVKQIQTTSFGERKLQGYQRVDEGSDTYNPTDGTQEQMTWYRTYAMNRIHLKVVTAMAILIIAGGVFKQKMSTYESAIYSTGLLTFTLANILSNIYAIYTRASLIAGAFVLCSLALYILRRESQKYHPKLLTKFNIPYLILIVLLLPLFVYTLAVNIRYVSIYMFFLPFLHFLGEDAQLTIREFLGFFL